VTTNIARAWERGGGAASQRTEGQEIVVTVGQDWLQPRTMNAGNWEPEGSIVRQLAEERQNER
jgi:hypothetical protein